MRKVLASALTAVAIVAIWGTPAFAQPASAPNMHGKLLFLRCASCHSIGDGTGGRIGPNLKDVFERKAGSLPGYNYSTAMKAQNFVWDDATLDRWLTQPNALVPGTAMAFGGISNEDDRRALIAYLKNPAP
jgi:cytochrome c